VCGKKKKKFITAKQRERIQRNLSLYPRWSGAMIKYLPEEAK
jgi:hypothetical protein